MALGANLAIAVAKIAGGLVTGFPVLLSEAAHSLADSLNELFLLASLRPSRRPADHEQHPSDADYVIGFAVLLVALLAESGSLVKALAQARTEARERNRGLIVHLRRGDDPALRTVLAEDATAVLGVVLAAMSMLLHLITGDARWEAGASRVIGALLVYVAYRLGHEAQRELIGQAVDPELQHELRAFLDAPPEIDTVTDLLTMRMGPDSTLMAVRLDLYSGLDSEDIELVCGRIREALGTWGHGLDQVFLDIGDASEQDRARAGRERRRLAPMRTCPRSEPELGGSPACRGRAWSAGVQGSACACGTALV
nr:cation transporter [Streptomyces sp. 846.5]